MSTLKTQAIILQIKDLGEFDQLVILYTKDFGKILVKAKSTKKPEAKLKNQLALFNLAWVKIAQGKSLDTLATIFVLESFNKLKTSLSKLSAGHCILELLNKLIAGSQKDERLWQLIIASLLTLDGLISKPPKLTDQVHLCLLFFQAQLLKILGYQPNLYQCHLCQDKLVPAQNFFSCKQGGILCQHCRQTDATPISANSIKLWRLLTDQSSQLVPRLTADPKIFQELSQLLFQFLTYQSSQQLQSVKFYNKILQEARRPSLNPNIKIQMPNDPTSPGCPKTVIIGPVLEKSRIDPIIYSKENGSNTGFPPEPAPYGFPPTRE